MDTKTRKPLLAVVCSLLLAVSLPAHETGFPEQTLKRVFPDATGFTLRKKTLTPEQIARIEQASQSKVQLNDNPLSYYVALGKPADGSGVLGTVVMVDTRGTKGLLDLAVGIRRDGTVAKVVVVENKDEPGLSADAFLNQLKGKNAQAAITVGKDVQYSGDVKAAQALVNAVRRGLHLLAAATAP
jgi:Na+-translocating ferredoxin:NAD+ oxidoreductase RnfG subunit